MLKPAANFLKDGGNISIDWNRRQITPPKTQQERWEEQEGYSPSTVSAIITGLVCAADIAKHVYVNLIFPENCFKKMLLTGDFSFWLSLFALNLFMEYYP